MQFGVTGLNGDMVKQAIKKNSAGAPKHQQLVLPTRPKYIPLPPENVIDPWSGLKRGKLKTLILPSLNGGKPPVKSIRIPNHGQNKRGCRLIILDSLLAYLAKLEQEQAV